MASERDLELLDDYLSNRLSSQDKTAFEQQLEADPDLKKELEFQQGLVEGIKQARVAELKGMLQGIPVSTIPTGQTPLIAKIGSLIVIGGIVATGLYFYIGNNGSEGEQIETVAPVVEEESVEDSKSAESTDPVEQSEPGSADDTASSAENNTVVKDGSPVPSPVKKPDISVYDPTKETEQVGLDPKEQIEIISKAFVTSSIKVETDSGNKDYSFHYMFKDRKLVLFGIQENDLYEILEFIYDDKRTVFLFYKSNYYWLDIYKADPTKLQPIRDKALLKKLKEYRVNK